MSLNVERVLDIFSEINKIPRKSKNETAISDWLYSWAKNEGFEVERDELLDVLIRVPGTKGYEDRDMLIFQGHMDMVCEKIPTSDHDFSVDPISMYEEDGWLKAKDTSLGADNGIALAIAMAIVTDKDVVHPPLELLFTVDEETGLTGATNLKPNWLKGKKLINIDSEDEGVFTIGCAGGRDARISLPKIATTTGIFDMSLTIEIDGLKGGHSGVEINLEKANSNILIARILKELESNDIDFGVISISGGTAHNAIPRNSIATIAVKAHDTMFIAEITDRLLKKVQREFNVSDPEITMTITESESEGKCDGKCFDKNIVDLILALPHGVMYNSMEMKGIPETSSNVAVISTAKDEFKIRMSQRSSVMSRLDEICNKIDSIVNLSGGAVIFGDGYPAWQPDFSSEILKDFKKSYNEVFKKEPVIEVIHAGLECGVIGSKYPGMEMISIGPTITSPHCPDEKMLISTIDDIWKLLVNYLKS